MGQMMENRLPGTRRGIPRAHVRRTLVTQVTVDLENGIGKKLRGNSLNLGLGGICVRLNVNLLCPDTPVLVRFAGSRSARAPNWPLRATVVWTSGSDAGLVFDDFDTSTLRALWNMLLRTRPRRRKQGRSRTGRK